MTEAQRDKEWHLHRGVTISLIISLLIQAGALIWWASDLSTRVEQIEEDQKSYSDMPERITRVETQVEGNREYLQRIEGKLDRVIENRR